MLYIYFNKLKRFKQTDDRWGPTQFSTAAFVLYNVDVIKGFEDFNLLHPALHMTILLFQSLHCYLLSSPIIVRIIQVESHLSKVTLETEQ